MNTCSHSYETSYPELAKCEPITPAEVVRENGFFSHPNLPDWGELVPSHVIQAWEALNNLKVTFVYMEGDNPSFAKSWFEKGHTDCSQWEPTPPSEDAFLLSIHDTEDGPTAWFAVPQK